MSTIAALNMAMGALVNLRYNYGAKEVTNSLTGFVGDCISNGLIPELAAEGKDPIPPTPQEVFLPRRSFQFVADPENQGLFEITHQEAAYLLAFANEMVDSGVTVHAWKDLIDGCDGKTKVLFQRALEELKRPSEAMPA